MADKTRKDVPVPDDGEDNTHLDDDRSQVKAEVQGDLRRSARQKARRLASPPTDLQANPILPLPSPALPLLLPPKLCPTCKNTEENVCRRHAKHCNFKSLKEVSKKCPVICCFKRKLERAKKRQAEKRASKKAQLEAQKKVIQKEMIQRGDLLLEDGTPMKLAQEKVKDFDPSNVDDMWSLESDLHKYVRGLDLLIMWEDILKEGEPFDVEKYTELQLKSLKLSTLVKLRKYVTVVMTLNKNNTETNEAFGPSSMDV